MDRGQLIKTFSATLQASLHGLQELEALLQQEQTALSGRDPDLLNQVVQDKLALLKQLAPSVQARDRMQKTAGLEAGLEGGERLVEMLGDPALDRDWTELARLAKIVADLNDRNAQLAMQGQRATRTALGILTGRAAMDDTYSGLRRKGAAASYSLGKV